MGIIAARLPILPEGQVLAGAGKPVLPFDQLPIEINTGAGRIFIREKYADQTFVFQMMGMTISIGRGIDIVFDNNRQVEALGEVCAQRHILQERIVAGNKLVLKFAADRKSQPNTADQRKFSYQ